MLLFCANALAAQVPQGGDDRELASRALEALKASSVEGWAYTEMVVEDGLETVSRFDPRRPAGEQWRLITVDGRTPTGKERKKAAERRPVDRENSESDSSRSGTVRVGITAEPDGLTLIEETPEYALYSIAPEDDDNDDSFIQHLDVTLKIIKEGPYVASIDMRSRRPFSPRFGIKIEEFATTMTYAPVSAGGPVLPQTVSVYMRAKMALVVKISEKRETTYTDYVFVGE